MDVFSKIKMFICDDRARFMFLASRGLTNKLSDEAFLKKRFKFEMGYALNLTAPKTFNEKLQWLKLYNRKPEYTAMVDKDAVKQIVADVIGEQYIIPTLGVWNNFDDIDFDILPDQFVLKCTHDSGGLVICQDKNKLDKDAARKRIEKSLKRDFYMLGREWPYKNVPRKIIAEKYMEDTASGELRDYKFFCFNGEPKLFFIASERQKVGEEVKFDFFDMEYNHLDFRHGHPNAGVTPKKPKKFDEMKLLAEKLAVGIPHVRVDFYEVNGEIYFGELTFFHHGGFVPFDPPEWDEKLGEWIDLQVVKR